MEFRIITYNIFGARLTNGRELARSLKKYNPDFIGLQEVDRNTKRSKFRDVVQEMAQELGYHYHYFQKTMDFDKGEFGIAFISKYDVKNIYFKGKILEGADYNTFEVLPNGNGKDKNRSYEYLTKDKWKWF